MAASQTTPENARRWFDLLQKSKSIILTAPTTPDGDSIGAQLAMKELILAHWKDKKVFLYHENPVNERFHILPGGDEFLSKHSANKIPFDQLDLCIVLDGGQERIGSVATSRLKPHTLVCQVDHHAVEGGFPYHLRWYAPDASSTGELVYRLLSTPPFDSSKLNAAMAQALYVSLVFDTGFFRHDCTTPETLRIASKLYEMKIPFSHLAEECLLLNRFEAKKLLSLALSNMERHFNNRVVLTAVSQKDIQSCQASEDDKDGLIEQMFLTRGADVGVLLFELPHQVTKVSFRSRTNFDVASFARTLAPKGGGHKKAAGCIVELPIKEAKIKILETFKSTGNFN